MRAQGLAGFKGVGLSCKNDSLCVMLLHQIEGENTKFVRLLTILNSLLLRFAEHSFVEVIFFPTWHHIIFCDSMWFHKFLVV